MPVVSCCIMLPDSRWFWTFWRLRSMEFTHLRHAATCRCWNHNFNHVIVWCQRSQPRRCTCVRCTWAFGVPVITYSMVKCYGYGPWVIISPCLSKFERWHLSIFENSWFVLICLLFVNNVGDRKDESCHQNHAIDSTRDLLGGRKRLRSRATSIPSGLSTTKWFESQSICGCADPIHIPLNYLISVQLQTTLVKDLSPNCLEPFTNNFVGTFDWPRDRFRSEWCMCHRWVAWVNPMINSWVIDLTSRT